jgi:hypothetical protein
MEEHYPKMNGYYLNEGSLYDNPRPLRMFLAFNGRTLIAVVHNRKLDHTGLKEIKLRGGYSLAVLADHDPKLINRLLKILTTMWLIWPHLNNGMFCRDHPSKLS